MKKIIIAVDGFSSCGKSTMAKALARKIGYLYFDSGAMYRAVALFCLENGLISGDKIDVDRLREKMPEIRITFETNTQTKNSDTHLNGKNVEYDIRSLRVSRIVSQVAALDFVRTDLIEQQRQMGKAKGIVMDGRDIGTTVFPDAEMKIFVTASAEVRAQRRYMELLARGEAANLQEIIDNVLQRDHIDRTRDVSPLRQADDAILLDNSHMSISEQEEWLYKKYLSIVQE